MKESSGWVLSPEGERIPYTLYRTPRRKRVHLVIDREGHLQVRAPSRFTHLEAERAIHTRSVWIIDTLRRMRTLRARRTPLQSGTQLPFLDETLHLRVTQDSTVSIIREKDNLHVRAPIMDEQNIKQSLERWYRRQANDYLPVRLGILADRVGKHPSKVSIRAQKTRWGSCSSRGHISLNWHLMLLPMQLVDYVLVHELCHLHYLDHSSEFWSLVSRLVPDCKQCRARLAEVKDGLVL
ncbi:MAG: M48 family metallopeptidase [Gammaproteobacteria bacterium]|nr:M48 family metallopeptidase [Gammaproteobacteria bacterium]